MFCSASTQILIVNKTTAEITLENVVVTNLFMIDWDEWTKDMLKMPVLFSSILFQGFKIDRCVSCVLGLCCAKHVPAYKQRIITAVLAEPGTPTLVHALFKRLLSTADTHAPHCRRIPRLLIKNCTLVMSNFEILLLSYW